MFLVYKDDNNLFRLDVWCQDKQDDYHYTDFFEFYIDWSSVNVIYISSKTLIMSHDIENNDILPFKIMCSLFLSRETWFLPIQAHYFLQNIKMDNKKFN